MNAEPSSGAHPDELPLLKGYLERLRGVVSEAFRTKSITTIGVGAGSYAVEKLARLFPRTLKNCDPDLVEVSNLSRTTYTLQDALLSRPKVVALESRLKAVNPWVEVVSIAKDVRQTTPSERRELFEETDLIIAGTDSFAAQAFVNEVALRAQTPCVFVGMHARADSGRIVWVVPGETGCYRCVAPERYEAAESPKAAVLDLAGMNGSLIDCQLIDMVALKVCVAILERGQESRMGRIYDLMAGRNDIVVRCDPMSGHGNDLWRAVLSDLPTSPKDFASELREQALFAMDSLWLQGRRDAECPLCGRRSP